MPVVDRLAVELTADLAPLREAFAEAERLAGDAATSLANAFAGQEEEGGAFAPLTRGVEVAARSIRNALVDAISGAEVEWDQVLSRMALRVSDLLVDQALQSVLGSTSGSAVGSSGGGTSFLTSLLGSLFGGFRAGGGPVVPDRAYVVGENGPELFVPPGAGDVLPGGSSAASAPSITVNVSTPDVAGFRRSQGQVTAAMARALAAARRYS
ncbi:MAG: hypothetical protein PHS60_12370 [Zavarzinia sp.]|nr:hypothetical protein [Zavarzinia sp.]